MLMRVTIFFAAMFAANVAQPSDRPSPGFADPVLDRWDITVDGDNGPYPSWLELRLRTERQLMAQLVGAYGSVRYATEVSYTEGELIVRVPVQYEGGDEDLVFTGSLVDDALVGRVRMGDGTTLDWRGVRAPALERGRDVTWGEPIELIGDDLHGWRMRDERFPGCWTVSDGILKAADPCIDIITDAEFEDFRLKLEFRYPPGGNSGVYLRGRYEVQIQDDLGNALDALRLGGIYGFIAPSIDAAKAAGEWQTYDVVLIGRRVTVALNGAEIISDRVIPGITGGALDSDEGSPGPLMLQGDHGAIEYRNIVITPAR